MKGEKRSLWQRWGIFNLVGVLGFAIQLGMLFLLKHLLQLDLVWSTAIAVEIAVLHNFIWHERVTWADVISPLRHSVIRRLVRFHLANGLISIAGNVALTGLLVRFGRWPYLVANTVSVLVCSLLNFLTSDRFVFSTERRPPSRRQVESAIALAWERAGAIRWKNL